MKILISGSSKGIGKAVAERFLKEGFTVIGLDLLSSTLSHKNYIHYQVDIVNKEALPDINDINYIFNNAGLQNSSDDITNNLKGAINVTEKYLTQDSLKAILFNASASSISGSEFSEYAASKAGLVGYMKNVAIRLAPRNIPVNAISLGGVLTDSNNEVIQNKELFKQIMDVTPMKKWTSLDEVVDWVYFLLIKNKSMSGENLLIDNGEYRLNQTFVWPK